MSVPVTSNFNMNANEVLQAAADRIGGEQISAHFARASRRALQLMMSDWSNRGIQMWTITKFTFLMDSMSPTYTMPDDCVDVSGINVTMPNGNDIMLYRVGRAAYQQIANKAVNGQPSQYFVERDRDPVNVTFWPVPNLSGIECTLYYRRKFKDVTALQDDLDIPFRYLEAATSGLSYFMGRESPDRCDEAKLDRLKVDYDEALERASDADQDIAPLYILPDLSMYTRSGW